MPELREIARNLEAPVGKRSELSSLFYCFRACIFFLYRLTTETVRLLFELSFDTVSHHDYICFTIILIMCPFQVLNMAVTLTSQPLFYN